MFTPQVILLDSRKVIAAEQSSHMSLQVTEGRWDLKVKSLRIIAFYSSISIVVLYFSCMLVVRENKAGKVVQWEMGDLSAPTI